LSARGRSCWIALRRPCARAELRHGSEQLRVYLHVYLRIDGLEFLDGRHFPLRRLRTLLLGARSVLGLEADSLECPGCSLEFGTGRLLDEYFRDIRCLWIELQGVIRNVLLSRPGFAREF
jgi:hypothetical protein